MESLKNLPLISDVSPQLPASVASWYLNTFASGTGPDNTFLLQDFFGSAAGIPGNAAIADAIEFITTNLANGNLTTVDDLYADMKNVVDDVYGTPPSITIPSGPAAGTYTTYDAALSALIVEVDAAIGVLLQTPGIADTSNTSWALMARSYSVEGTNMTKASIDYTNLSTTAQMAVTSFMTNIANFGLDTQEGMSAQVLECLADLSNQYGQALVGAMREGRNNARMDAANIGYDNGVPDQPTTEPPQATLIPSQYTVSEARAVVTANLTS